MVDVCLNERRGSAFEPTSSARASADVVLIGYQDQGNLGMGYLAAVLRERGRTVEMIDVRDDPDRIATGLLRSEPTIIGFSLIFQFFLPQYRRLAGHLRTVGITSHFTMGGHYPTLCYEEVLRNMPELDSVVRYEGELTLIDLLEKLDAGEDWRNVFGIAYRHANQANDVFETAARPLVADLDSLPFPYRPYEPERIGGFPTLPLLASRGCARRCSFCSIHTFYRTAPGKVVRVRKPAQVIKEMLHLHRQHRVRVFLFQDDDFPLWGRVGRRWADELVERMHESGLADRTLWKISCRAEYVEPELFARLRDAGLFLVYMGIESGVEQGLEVLHKQMTIEQNLAGVRTLKQLGVLFSYGFMLFDPSSSFESIRQNIGFLRQIVGDGSAAATFCRMLPYGGTPIRDRLEKEGRLRGDLTHPDYDFLDLRLNEYHRLLSETVRPWIHNEGLSHQLNYAWDELETITRLAPDIAGADGYRKNLRRLTIESNEKLFCLVENSSAAFEHGDRGILQPDKVREYCGAVQGELISARNRFVAKNIESLMGAISRDYIDSPIMAPQTH